MNPQYNVNRRTIYLTCLGLDIYILAIYSASYGMSNAGSALIELIPDVGEFGYALSGIIMICSVLLGLVLIWLYANEEKERGCLFYGKSLRTELFSRSKSLGPARLVSYTALLFSLQLISVAVFALTERILNVFGYTAMESPALNMDNTLSSALMLYAVLVAPVFEEIVFRGFILKALKPCGRVYAIVISALMFSLMHGDIQQTFFTFACGLLLGYTAMEYSIYASILLHIINNALFGELLSAGREMLPESVYVIIACVLIIGSIILTIVKLVRGRKKAKAYIQDNPTAAGSYHALINRWFIAFAVGMIGVTLTSIASL